MSSVKSLVIPTLMVAMQFSVMAQNKEFETSLASSFAQDFKFGFAVNDDIVSEKSPLLANIVKMHANTITLENSMKAEVISPKPHALNFEPADTFVEFGTANNMFMVGHTLVWHNQTPAWFFNDNQGNPNTPEQQLSVMHEYIKEVASRYAGKIHAWDVVNEIIGEDGNYRDTIWVQRMGNGNEVVKAAFKLASLYAPDAELYYNDFNAWRPEKRDGIVRMVKMLQAHGIRIDGIGIQAHWGLNFPENHYIEQAIDAYAALGLKVMITELDVDVLPVTKEGQVIGQGLMHSQFELPEFEKFLDPYKDGLPLKIEEQLTQRYLSLFKLFASKRDVIDRVTLWGVEDSMSWKNYYPIANRTNYPLLWDRQIQAKPVVEALIKQAKK